MATADTFIAGWRCAMERTEARVRLAQAAVLDGSVCTPAGVRRMLGKLGDWLASRAHLEDVEREFQRMHLEVITRRKEDQVVADTRGRAVRQPARDRTRANASRSGSVRRTEAQDMEVTK